MTTIPKAPLKRYELENKKIGHVTVLRCLGTQNKMKKYLVRCECGNLHEAYGKSLISLGENNTEYRCDKCRNDPVRRSKIEFIRFIESKAWKSWIQMVRTCYPRSGNVNRSMSKKWYDFFEFLKDMGEPKANERLFHTKQFGEYNKSTCAWADKEFILVHSRYL